MYSGGDSSGEGVNSHNQFNWQMLSQTSCNVNSGGAIDWASLAQQWIQMKDSGANLPDAPPPPLISSYGKSTKSAVKFDEQGEADMEVEREDETPVAGFVQNSHVNNFNSDRWFPQQQPEIAAFCAPQPNQWTPAWPPRVTLPPPALHVPIIPENLSTPILKETTPSVTPPLQNTVKTTPAPLMPSKELTEAPPMDAAKRKVLPAWIREGLEKMEREKLKQLEREKRENQSPPAAGIAPTESDIKDTVKSMVKNSLTEMEGESSGNEALNDDADGITPSPYEDIDGDAMVTPADSQQQLVPMDRHQEESINSFSGKTYEERVSDMMIAVRKTLTELLLEVTNDEISKIAHEAIRKQRAKASSAQVIRKSAIPSITGKLGLEAYADSDSENSASDDETDHNDSRRHDDGNDSEEELKANIRICKRAFAKKIEEIEEMIAESTAREEQLLKEHQQRSVRHGHGVTNNSTTKNSLHKTKGFDPDIGEPQPDKKLYSNGKRRGKERASRFSDSKDLRHRVTGGYYPPASSSMGMPSSLPPQFMPGGLATVQPALEVLSSKQSTSSLATGGSVPVVAAVVNEKQQRSPRNSQSVSSSVKASKSQSHSLSHSSSRHRQRRRRSDSSSSSSSTDSTSTGSRSSHSRRSKHSETTHHKRLSSERSKRSHRSESYRSSRRGDSSDSNDDDHRRKQSSHYRPRPAKGSTSSLYSRRQDRRRRSRSKSSRSRTRTRSRSRSRSTTYSTSRRGDRY